jgi:hypothetical protein
MADPAYLTATTLANFTLAPADYLTEVEGLAPGWIAARLASLSRLIDARLRKRYAAPFASPYPEAVQNWLAQLFTPELYLKRGVDPTDAQFAAMQKIAEDAWAQVTEAATADENKFDLPLRADTHATGITYGAPLAYTETSPYVWRDVQRRTAEEEDDSGEGSFG